MALGRPTRHVVGSEHVARHAHLAGDVLHGVVGQLVAAAGEAAAPQEELQTQGETESGRPRLVAQLVALVADQGEVIDNRVQAQVARHVPAPYRAGGVALAFGEETS